MIQSSEHMQMRFWGVRGSIPTPQAENLGYGGNTACLEVRCAGQPPLIFDGGSGVRLLGHSLLREFPTGAEGHLFFTHFHWDHIQGVPFFLPLYRPDWRIRFHSSRKAPELERLLAGQMSMPYFPVALPAVQAAIGHAHVPKGGLSLDDFRITPIPLNHPNGATGYRIDRGGRSIVYATDHEHGNAALDQGLIERSAGADIFIYDAQYTLEEYQARRGWGHSTWQQGARIAQAAGVKQLILFHHDPMHDDAAISRIVADAVTEFPNTIAAREGWRATL